MRQLLFTLFFTISLQAISQIGWIPKWSFLADSGSSICSPMVVNDIAIIGSGWENATTNFALFAVDINSGSLLWNKKFDNQIIGISAPHKGNIIAAGRKGIFSCINYETGSEVWKFDRNSFGHLHDSLRFNFNQPQWIDDLNGDGEKDLIAIYGGGSTAKKPFRPAGFLLAIDGVNGSIIASDTMPDGNESYATPLIYNNQIYFGSGGETVGGSFYQTSISDLLNGYIQQSKVIATDIEKGFIAAPTIYGSTMLIPGLNETIFVYDLKGDSMIFQFSLAGNEIYSSIHVVDNHFYFTSQKGKWPFYQGYSINKFSDNGVFLDSSTYNTYHFASPISVSHPNGLLIAENKDLGTTEVNYNHKFKIVSRDNFDSTIIETSWIYGIHLFSTPRSIFLVDDKQGNISIDCDKKGFLTVSGFDNKSYYHNSRIVVSYYEFPSQYYLDNSTNHFGGYLGNLGNGIHQNNHCQPVNITVINEPKILIFPNPTSEKLFVLADENIEQIQLLNLDGKTMIEQQFSVMDVSNIKPGIYFIVTKFEDGNSISKKIIIGQ